jgi:hypothetical protein
MYRYLQKRAGKLIYPYYESINKGPERPLNLVQFEQSSAVEHLGHTVHHCGNTSNITQVFHSIAHRVCSPKILYPRPVG